MLSSVANHLMNVDLFKIQNSNVQSSQQIKINKHSKFNNI